MRREFHNFSGVIDPRIAGRRMFGWPGVVAVLAGVAVAILAGVAVAILASILHFSTREADAQTATPFQCDGTPYIIQGSPSQLSRINTSASPYAFQSIGSTNTNPINALAYRAADNYLYAYRWTTSRQIVRIDANGTVANVTTPGGPMGLPAQDYNAGAIDQRALGTGAGTYYLMNTNATDMQNRTLYKVTLGGSLNATGVAKTNLTQNPGIADFAVNPNNGLLYGLNTTGELVTINPSSGAVTETVVPNLPTGSLYGGAWFNTNGDLFALRNTSGTNLFQIQISTSPSILGSNSAPASSQSDGASCSARTPSSDLSISKSDSPDPVDAGGALTYTLNVANTGPDTSNAPITVTDTLPSGAAFRSASGTGWNCSQAAGVVACTYNSALPLGNAPPITITTTAPNSGATLTNTATVAGTTLDPASGNNSASIQTTVTPVADLALDKSAPAQATDESQFDYSISVTNNGPSAAQDVVIRDNLPDGVQFIQTGSDSRCTASNGVVTCNLGAMNSGGQQNVTIRAQAKSPGEKQNTATVSANTADRASANNTDSAATQVVAPDLAVTKTDNQTNTASGRDTTYTVNVTNNGPSNVTGATFTDNVPTGINNVNWTCRITTGTGNCGAASGTGNNISTTLGLNANAVATFSITGTVASDAPATLSNTANIATPSEVSDSNTNNNSATDTTSVNRAPSAANNSYTTDEDRTLTVDAPGILGNDSDPDSGQTLTPEIVGGASNGTVNLNANGSFSYNPNANYNGTDTFSYRVCDDGTPRLCSGSATVSITVNPVNDPPTANNDTKATDEDTPLTFPATDLTANDTPGPTNENGQTLTVQSVGNAQGGTVSLSNGQITFTPNENYNGPASFTYTVSDGQGGTATATVNITVRPVNDPPDAVNDSRTTNEDTSVDINVRANDTDPEGNTLTVGSVSEPRNGTTTINQNGGITYAPNRDFAGTDTFTYTINDGNGGMDTATVTVTVDPVNDAPVNSVPGEQTIDEDTSRVFSTANGNRISISDVDANGNPVRVTLSVPEGSGTLTLSGVGGLTFTAGDGTNDRTMTFAGTVANINTALDGLRYDPASNFNGNPTLTITTNDRGNTGSGGELTDEDTVPIVVRSVNDAPTISEIPARTIDEDSTTGAIPFTVGDVETAAGDLVVSATSSNTDVVPNDNITLGGSGSDRTVNITPRPDRSGEATITLTVRDAGGATSIRTFVLTVNPVNDPPIIDLNGSDEGTGYIGSFEEGGGPVPAGAPNALFVADIDDENIERATVTLTNRPDGNSESLTADIAGTEIGTNYNPDTGVLTLFGPATKAQFQQVLRSVRYNNDSQNPDTTNREITFVVNDGDADSNTATSTISVSRTNDAPTAEDNSYTTNEDETLTVDAPGVLGNDSDPDGDELTVEVGRGPLHGTATLDEDGSFEYVPNANFNGSDSFTYTVSDGNGGTDTATVSLTINPVNDAPIAQNDRRTIPEDQTLNFPASDLLQNDSPGPNEANQTIRVTSVGNADNGGVRLDDNGTPDDPSDDRVIFTPAPDFNGVASFSYTVCDDGTPERCSTADVNIIDVTPVNDVPIADDDSAETDEDTPVAINVLEGDEPGPENESGQTLEVVSVGQPTHGATEIISEGENAGQVRYTPNVNYNGPDSFAYTACDDGSPSRCDTATVTVVVNPVNDAPVARANVYEINEDETLTVDAPGILGDDRDIDGDTLTVVDGDDDPDNGISPVEGPDIGTLTLDDDGSFEYVPDPGFGGQDTFTYRVSDGNGGFDEATVTISTEPINDPPEADDDSYETEEDETLTIAAPGVLENDTDADDGDTLTVAVDRRPQHGTFTLDEDGSFEYAPNANYFGDDSFTYTVSDGNGGTDAATVSLTINPVNDAPIARADERQIPEDQVLNVAASELLQNDSPGPNEGNQTIRVTDVGGAVNGEVRLDDNGTPDDPSDDRVIFTPNANYNGPAEFTYTVCDDGTPEECSDSEVNIVQVTPINDLPIADDDSATTDEDTPVDINVLEGDVAGPENERSGQTLRVAEITAQPANGSAEIITEGENAGQIRYTPDPAFNGTDTLEYRVCDDGTPVRCDTALVTVTVAAVNDGPENSVPGEQTVNEDTPLVFSQANGNRLSVSDPDAGGEPVRATISVENGLFTLGSTGGLTFVEGDGIGDATTTFTGTISAINAALEGSQFVPNANYNGGNAGLTITTNDQGNTGGGELEDSDTVPIVVNAVNDAPTISAIEDETTEEDTATGEISFTVDDEETAPGELIVSATSSNTDLVPNENIEIGGTGAERAVTISPAENRSGTSTITVVVRDAGGAERVETFVLTVEPVNDAPVNDVPETQETEEDTPLTFSSGNENAISISDVDANGGEVSVTVSVPEGAGTLTVVETAGIEVGGDGTRSLTLTGTVENINAALDGLRFDPAPDTNGDVTLTIETNDGGNTGSGGELTDTDTVAISVGAVNDPPSFVLPESPDQSVDEDAPAQTVENFAAEISPGANEEQNVRFEVENDNNDLFAEGGQPAISPDGTLTYTPAQNANGSATVTVVAVDDGGTPEDPDDDVRSEPRTLTITVTAINDAPTISPEIGNRTTDEDTPIGPISFTVGDIETDANDLVVSATSSNPELVPNGNIELGGSGAERAVTISPAENRNGTATITLTVRDSAGRETTRTFTLTVTAVNDAPTADDDEKTAFEDEELTFPATDLLANDSAGPNEEDEQTLTVESVDGAENGTVSLDNGTITFTPAENFVGDASFTYTVSDGNGGTATATVIITITAQNDAPTIDLNGDGAGTGYTGSFEERGDPVPAADPEALAVADVDDEDIESARVRLVNHPDGSAESLVADTGGTDITASYESANGTLTLTGPATKEEFERVLRSVTYENTSRNPSIGERRIEFTVNDGDAISEVAVSTITVSSVEDAPEITVSPVPIEYGENYAPTIVAPAATVSDADSANFGGGRLTVDFAENGTSDDRLAIRNEGVGEGEISTDGSNVAFGGVVIGTFAGGTDGETPLVITFNENATPEAAQAVVRNITFENASEEPSGDPRSIRFVIADGDGGESEPATKTVNVNPANDAPVLDLNGDASGINFTADFTEDGGEISIVGRDSLTVTDADDENIEGATITLIDRPDGDDESLSVDVPEGSPISAAEYDPATGELTLSGSATKSEYRDILRTLAYGNASQNPTAADRRIDLAINDGDDDSETATSTIRVSAAPDAPNAVNDEAEADEDGDAVVIAALANDTDADGDALTIESVTQPPDGQGAVEIIREGEDAGKLRFTPNADFFGETRFTYTIKDGNGGTSTARVAVTVTPTNDDPTARNDELSVAEDAEFTRIDALANDTDDPDRDETLTIESVGETSDGGTVEIVEEGAAVRYRPAPNFTGTETFTYTVSDGNGGTDTATVTVTVGGENDAPAIEDFGGAVEYREGDPPLAIAPNATITDPDSPDFDGGELAVSLTDNGQSSSRIGIRTGDGISTDGENVTFEGEIIGTFTGGVGNEPLFVSFNENATVAAVQALVRNITDQNVSEDPSEQPRTVTFRLTDGDGGVTTAQKTINVVAVNDPPTIEFTTSPSTADEGETVTYSFTVSDPDSDGFAAADDFPNCGDGGELVEGSLTTGPNGGSFQCRFADGPANPSVTMQVVDDEGEPSNTIRRSVEVANLAPVADEDGPYDTDEDALLEVTAENGLLAGDNDAGDDPLVAELVEGPPADAGELAVDEDGSFAFDPADNFNGPVSFTYRACEEGSDPRICSDPVEITINVASINDRPAANDDAATTREDERKTINVLANDNDPDGNGDLDPMTVRVVEPPRNGTATVNTDGSITYAPNENFNGDDPFSYQVCDAAGECSTATVRVTVNPVNDAPIARDDEAETPEDTELRIPQSDLLDNDAAGPANENGQNLRITAVEGAENGTVRLADNGDVIFTPAPNYNGPASFRYTMTDGAGNTDTATANVEITVSAVNDDPVGQPDTAATDEDESAAIDVLGNDDDPENDSLSIAEDSLTRPQNGTVEIADGQIRYTPNDNFSGEDSFNYRASDGNGGLSAPIRVTVTVNPINDPPTGNPSNYETGEDTPLEVAAPGVLSNDSDPEDERDELTARLESDVENGTLTLNDDGSFRYEPDENYNGTDSFTYVVVDTEGAESDPVMVNIAVGVENDAPNAVADTAETDEDTPITIDVLANDDDPDNDDLSIRSVGDPENGRAVVRDGQIRYTPNRDFNGTDTFEYTVADANGGTDTATVTVTINAVNDPPTADDDDVSTPEDTELRIPQSELLENDEPGPEGETGQLRITDVGNAQNGTVRFADDGSGDIIFTPNRNYSGPASFVYTVTDGAGNTDMATANVDVTVDPVNDVPEAIDDRATTGEDESVTIDVLANDNDPEGDLDISNVEVITAPQNGATTVNDNGSITYNPRANFNGTDTFTYRVCDADGECDTATVEVVVGAANDAPTATGDEADVDEDESVRVDVLANDEDPDGPEDLDPSSVEVTRDAGNGRAAVNNDGSITYTPGANFSGTDSFEYEVCDTGDPAQCDTATVNITVAPVNDPPSAADDTAMAEEGGPAVIIGALEGDTDPEDDPLAIESVTQPPTGQGTVQIIEDGENAGKLRFIPNADYFGETRFTYTVSDGKGGTDTATVTVSVAATNDDPTASDDVARATEGGQPVPIDVLDNDRISPDRGETLMITNFTQPPAGQGTVECSGTRCTFTPNADFSGDTTFTYTIEDGSGGSATATVSVGVGAVNDPPEARPDTRTVAAGASLTFPASELAGNDSAGDEGQTLTVTEVSGAQNGTVALEDGEVTFTPEEGYEGSASFTYRVCDDGDPQRCATGTVKITVTPAVADPPVAEDDSMTTGAGQPVTINVLSNDTGEINPSSLRIVSRPQNGTARVNDEGTITFTPRGGFSGTDTFEYRVCNDADPAGCATATVNVTVEPVASPPRADLSVQISAPNRIRLGKNFRYTITTRNNGPDTARNVASRIVVPKNVRVISVPRGCRVNRSTGVVTCNLGEIADGAAKRSVITVKPVRAGSVRLRGCSISSSTPDPNASNNGLGQSNNARTLSSAAPENPETTVLPTDSENGGN